jgi:hypothetical protein
VARGIHGRSSQHAKALEVREMNPTEAQDSMASWAYIAGRRAGMGSLSPSTNPYWPGTIEYSEWDRGRVGVTTEPDAELNKRAALARAVA